MAKYKETTKKDWNMKVRLDALWHHEKPLSHPLKRDKTVANLLAELAGR